MTDYYTPANRDWITRKDLDMGNISPVIFDLARWRAPWTELVRERSEEFNQFASNDPRFHAIEMFPPDPVRPVPNAVGATVLIKTSR